MRSGEQAGPQSAFASGDTFTGPNDPQELEAFLDDLIPQLLEEHRIPGATVAVVKGDALLLAKGYGYADLATRRPFVADQTLFRIGSTGKLFTWTAVMQLVEQGRLDLDADVNVYLEGFQIPDTYSKPITLRHLLSHTAGFEERSLGAEGRSPAEYLPLREYVKRYPPARVRPPGEITAYSNYGAALAGYIVEAVAGVPFEQYIEEHIFQPLGMARSTFRQPLPPELAGDLALAYDTRESGSVQPFRYINMQPAGSMSATATDLARFMIAHLQDGRYGTTRILLPETARLMHERLFANDPRLNGMAYGFMDRRANGQHLLEHGGGLPTYFGLLALLPESQVGFYVGFNGQEGWTATEAFRQAFLDHYYPWQPVLPAPPPADFVQRAGQFEGTYHITRANETSIEKIVDVSGMAYARVSGNADGTLTVALALGSGQAEDRFVEVEPRVFRSVDGRKTVIFRADEWGRATHLLLDSEVAFERIAWYEEPKFSQVMLIFGLAGLSSALAAAVIGIVAKRRASGGRGWAPRLARWWAVGTSAAALLLFAGVMLFVATGGLSYGTWLQVSFLAGLAWLIALLAVGMVCFAALAWKQAYWSWAGCMHYTLVALAAIALVWVLANWNLLTFRI